MVRVAAIFSVLLVLPCLSPVEAAEGAQDCTVVDVTSGDTLRLSCGSEDHVVLLAHVDAPELDQGYGQVARVTVLRLAGGEEVKFAITDSRFSHKIGEVTLADGTDLAQELVERGLAWALTSAGSELRDAQRKAKAAKEGLWIDANPTPPWLHRAAPAASLTPRTAPPPGTSRSCTPRSQCCKVCSGGKACGNSCISRSYNCHKGRGCACNASEVC
jgi:endonuclease YncB( thermonuclease family)